MKGSKLLSKFGKKKPSASEATPREALRLLERWRERERELGAKEQSARRDLASLATMGKSETLLSCVERLSEIEEEQAWLRGLNPKAGASAPMFAFSSWLLADAMQWCTATIEEGMCLIVGVESGGLRVGVRLAKFDYEHRSIVHASADRSQLHKITIDAHCYDHKVLTIAHAHPGRGPESIRPSGTDLQSLSEWQRTIPLLGAIFSRDGYLRWFSTGLKYSIQILGNGMEKIDEDLYRFVA